MVTPPAGREAAKAGKRARRRLTVNAAAYDAADTAKERLIIAYNWFLATWPGPDAQNEAAGMLRRLAEAADEETAEEGRTTPPLPREGERGAGTGPQGAYPSRSTPV